MRVTFMSWREQALGEWQTLGPKRYHHCHPSVHFQTSC